MFSFCSLELSAQNLFDYKINFHIDSVTLEQALDSLERWHNVGIQYNSDIINNSRTVSAHYNNIPLMHVLLYLLKAENTKSSRIKIRTSGRQIYLKRIYNGPIIKDGEGTGYGANEDNSGRKQIDDNDTEVRQKNSSQPIMEVRWEYITDTIFQTDTIIKLQIDTVYVPSDVGNVPEGLGAYPFIGFQYKYQGIVPKTAPSSSTESILLIYEAMDDNFAGLEAGLQTRNIRVSSGIGIGKKTFKNSAYYYETSIEPLVVHTYFDSVYSSTLSVNDRVIVKVDTVRFEDIDTILSSSIDTIEHKNNVEVVYLSIPIILEYEYTLANGLAISFGGGLMNSFILTTKGKIFNHEGKTTAEAKAKCQSRVAARRRIPLSTNKPTASPEAPLSAKRKVSVDTLMVTILLRSLLKV